MRVAVELKYPKGQHTPFPRLLIREGGQGKHSDKEVPPMLERYVFEGHSEQEVLLPVE